MSAFVRELLKERVDEALSCEDWDDSSAAHFFHSDDNFKENVFSKNP